MRMMVVTRWAAALGIVTCSAHLRAADPWADSVVSYDAGSNADPGYTTAGSALGEPTRFSNPTDPFGGVVTPLSPSFGTDETVSIGAGGQLTVRFDEPVTNHGANPFGIDLLVFGNSFFNGNFFGGPPDFAFNPAAPVTGITSDGGAIEVSSDGASFVSVAGAADGLYPTNGFADILSPFTAVEGSIEADFTRPVNPAFDPVGKTFAQVIAGYEGSGGGLGIDIGVLGLSSISFVRITNPTASLATPDIDGFADVAPVPEPAASTAWVLGTVLFAWQNRGCRYRSA